MNDESTRYETLFGIGLLLYVVIQNGKASEAKFAQADAYSKAAAEAQAAAESILEGAAGLDPMIPVHQFTNPRQPQTTSRPVVMVRPPPAPTSDFPLVPVALILVLWYLSGGYDAK